MFLPSGERLGAVDAMTYAWTGRWPENRAPLLTRITTSAAEMSLVPGATFTAEVLATVPDGDPLIARWEVRSETVDRKAGGDAESEPPAHPESFVESHGLHGAFRAPDLPGAYRLYVYVYDGKGHAATANVPFSVRR